MDQRRVAVAGMALFLAACTTVTNGPMQRVYVDSEPRGAAVELKDCGAMATKSVTTPGVVWVSRRSTQCRLVLRKPYFETETVRLTRRVAKNMHRYADTADVILSSDIDGSFGDALILTGFLLLPSFAIDAASGSMFELQPHSVTVPLRAQAQEWREP